MSELLWVAVPNGLRPTSKASIRVLVVPRLTADSLGEIGLTDWPATLIDEVAFELRTRTSIGESRTSHRIEHVARARSEVWTEFFGGDGGLITAWEQKTVPAPTVSRTFQDAKKAVATYRAV